MNVLGPLRRRILTPDLRETDLDVRGFHVKSPAARERLETVGRSFLTGYAHAAEAKSPTDVEPQLEAIPVNFRGFAYEGAGMAFAVRDGLPVGGRDHVAGFLAGRADRHVYMVYVGVGWAMARIPRFRWSTLHAPDPLLRWLVLDGYGFHQAYFHTARYVTERFQRDRFPWPGSGPAWYANRVIDQGIGRATWFVCGTDPQRVVQTFARFPEHRRADLYSGAGLAATYAGGVEEAELVWFREAAGVYAADIAQGAAFAAGARIRADLLQPHNELACAVLCDMGAAEASKVTDEARIDLDETAADGVPAYEVWRRRVRAVFAPTGPGTAGRRA
jgi:hypothetical protein